MSWTTPKTWVSGNTLTAAELNTHVRDNFNAAIPVTTTITTTGTQTALAIPDGRGDLVIFCNNASTLTLQGITAAQNGQTLTLVSIGAGSVAIQNQSGSASAANRIVNQVTGTITLVAGKGRVTMVYDSTNSRWRVMQHEQGAWITPTFNAGDYTASAGSWTVDSSDVTTFAYILDGSVLTMVFYIVSTDVSTTPSQLIIAVPNSLTASKTVLNTCVFNDAGTGNDVGFVQVLSGATTITINKLTGSFTATSGDNTSVFGQITFEVS